jgi:hypothetical protein
MPLLKDGLFYGKNIRQHIAPPFAAVIAVLSTKHIKEK